MLRVLLLLAFPFLLAAQSSLEEQREGDKMPAKPPYTKNDLKQRLSPEEYRVTQEKGTEAPFTGEYWNHKSDGRYHCVVCDSVLFDSETKYDSGCGWPSFFASNEGRIDTKSDNSLGMTRTEILCSSCGAHLGHVFDDGPQPTGVRFCVNSASLSFQPEHGDSTETDSK